MLIRYTVKAIKIVIKFAIKVPLSISSEPGHTLLYVQKNTAWYKLKRKKTTVISSLM